MLRSVDDVSDSDEGVEVANPHPNPGICLKAIDEVSSASSAGAEGQKKRSKNKRLKRKRTSTELPSMKERLAGPSCVKGLLSKSCKKCSQNCMQKFFQRCKLGPIAEVQRTLGKPWEARPRFNSHLVGSGMRSLSACGQSIGSPRIFVRFVFFCS